MAILISFLESLLTHFEYFSFTQLDAFNYLESYDPLRYILIAMGLLMIISGQYLRTLAQMTAGRNFHHQVRYRKEAKHTLVTEGVYQISRHPSYLGWYLWAVGTQVMMINVASTVFFIITSWFFFNHRIQIEEELLIDFFGADYVRYCDKVPTRLPFIKGYVLE